MEFYKRFNEILQKRNIASTTIATDLALSNKRFQNFLSGKSEPTGKILFDICKYLNVSSDYLLGLSDSTQLKTRSSKERDSSLRLE